MGKRTGGAQTHRRHAGRLGLALALMVSAAIVLPNGADAGTTGTVTATVPVLVRSITVSTGAFDLGSCTLAGQPTSGLAFPSGHCTSPFVQVTAGQTAEHVLIQTTRAWPADDTGPNDRTHPQWAPLGGTSPPATAVDQFVLSDVTAKENVGLSPVADLNFGANGAAVAGAARRERFVLIGPQASTDNSPTFTFQITWTASP
jgi:hypothetical protein